MNTTLLSLAIAIGCLAPFSVHAQSVDPTPEDVKKVVDYFHTGKDKGPILFELKPCLTIDANKGSPTQWDCTEPVTGPVKKGTTVSAWMAWLIPANGKYEDVTIQWLQDGQLRAKKDFPLAHPTWRLRTYLSQNLWKPGKWEVKIVRGDKELGAATVQVQ